MVKIQLAVLYASHENRHQECRDNRDVVKSHRDLEDIFKRDAETQIKYQEHGDRQKGNRVALDLFLNVFVLHDVKDRKVTFRTPPNNHHDLHRCGRCVRFL